MTKTAKRFFSMLLALSLVFGLFVMPASATGVEEATEPAVVETTEPAVVEETVPAVETAEQTETAEVINLDEIELSFDMSSLWADEDVEIDEEDPMIIAVEDELDEIKVLNAEGDPVPLTDEQKAQVLGLYQQYLNHWKANADLLGVQTPFFLSYNDNKDSLGVLGEMLVLAGISVDVVRAGYMKFDDITGMIQNFMYGDALGIAFYGDKIKSARDEVMNLIKNSGAKTDVQKYLLLNTWLGQNTTFDMPYIMNTNKEPGKEPMVAKNPVKHEYYDNVYNVIKADYEKQLQGTFDAQIRTALEAEFKNQYYVKAIENVVYQGALAKIGADAKNPTEEQQAAAKAATEEYMTANAEAIAANPVAFIDSQDMFKQNAPVTDAEGNYIPGEDGVTPVMMPLNQQLHAGWDAFWADAKTNGIEIDPVNAPGVKLTVDQIITMQMDTPQQDPMLQKPDGSYMTPNEAVKAFSAQAAAGLTDGVINYWQGSHFGALGRGTAVCLGYTKAFTYLTQFMHPEIYGVNGAGTDMTKAENWKDASELYYNADGALDINQNYVVDTVRISFNARVTMYGITQDNFNSDHFWNAVKVDGQWYYIDPCYTDVYTEVMIRDRVETDGFMNHLYFMFSHNTCAQLYAGYYSEIKTLYASAANSDAYEDSWISRIKSNVFFNGGYAYYLYDSTDIVDLMEDYKNNEVDPAEMTHSEIKLVRHKLDTTDIDVAGDSDYETLIHFNYKASKDSDPVARVLNPADGSMVNNDLLTKLYDQFMEDQKSYSSLAITMGLYNGKAYFNLSNCILSYDIASGAVALVKEYNTVHAKRDTTKPFGGMAFNVVSSADQADFTVENRPIAAMTIKNDGKMYVSIATNFAFISGKDPHNSEDQSSFGYEFEESNFNPNYSTYTSAEYDDSMYESFGYTEEINDNDEFMWSANFVETLSMSHLAGSSHSYKSVTVDPSCGRNGFTEDRCTTCGASKAGSRVEKADSAHKHHYVYFEEEYYTKNKDTGKWNTGFSYVCTECNFAIEEPVKPQENELGELFGISYEEMLAAYEAEKAIYDEAVATAGHVYAATDAEWTATGSSVTFSKLVCGYACPDRAATLDCLLNDKTITTSLKEKVTAKAVVTDGYGDCSTGATAIYTATGTAEGKKYEVSTAIALKAGQHVFVDSVCVSCGKGRVTRISGPNRYDTAFEAADTLKEIMGVDKFNNIVVACGTNFADALSGSYLANKKSAPILLVNNNTIDAVVDYVLDNLKADGTVYLLGGSAAVPASLEEALADVDVENVKRLSGKTRYETNLEILKEAGVTNEDVLICTGTNFADSLSASAVCRPILLVNQTLTDGQKAFLDSLDGNKLYIIGGTAAVSDAMAAEVSAYGAATRLKGSDRYATSVVIAEAFFKNPTDIVLAYGHNFPDGLSGGPVAYALNAPMILNRAYSEFAAEYAADNAVATGLVLGGAKLISDDACREIFGMAETDKIAEK